MTTLAIDPRPGQRVWQWVCEQEACAASYAIAKERVLRDPDFWRQHLSGKRWFDRAAFEGALARIGHLSVTAGETRG